MLREARKPPKPREDWEIVVAWLGLMVGPVLMSGAVIFGALAIEGLVTWWWSIGMGICGIGATEAGRRILVG